MNKATLDPALDNNATSMERFIDGIAAAANSGNLDHIVVYGYASPEGSFFNNDRLSRQRCNVIANYISRHAGIPLDDIHTFPGGVAWDGLRALVSGNTDVPSRAAVLRILDEYLPESCTDETASDQCRKRLIAIDKGRTYRWMLENLFPKLRFSLAVQTCKAPESSTVHPILENIEFDPWQIFAEDIVVSSPPSVIEYTTPVSYRPMHRLAVKTNLLYDVVLVPNLEVEWRVNDCWSVALEGGGASVGKYDRGHAWRLSMLSPEVKRWIRPRGPWHGFYVGLFAGGALYDYEKRNKGYYGDGVMGGLSVGYMWPVSRCLSLEAAIGAGYLYTRYKEYVPMDGHHVYQRTKDLNYFGPLKVRFSLVWRLWDLNKPEGLNEKTIVRYEE